MANQLEKFYSSFSGTDTRSNKLLQDPKSFRKGSKNFRYNFQDEIQNRQGFQHKNLSNDLMQDIFEYKYKDVNTGQSKSQLLAVSKAGELYRERIVSLRFSNPSSRKISVYYDDVSNLFKIDFKNSSDVLLGSVSFDTSVALKDDPTTTASIVGKINAITGATNVTASVLRDDGVFLTSSTLKAYLIDFCYNVTEDTYDNSMFYWEKVPYPNSTPFAFPNNRPFITTYTYSNNPSSTYQGISYVNLNNCIYITDGGFPMKYDGKAVYRAGVPEIRQIFDGTVSFDVIELSGLAYNAGTNIAKVGTGLTNSASFYYKTRFGHRDINGSIVYGILSQYGTLKAIPGSGINYVQIENSGYKFGHDFNVYSCTIASNAAGSTSGGTGSNGAVSFTTDTILMSDINATTININTGVTVHLNGYKLYRTGAITNNGFIFDAVNTRSGGTTTYNVLSGHNIVEGQCLVIKRYAGNNDINGDSGFNNFYYAKVTSVGTTTITITDIIGTAPNNVFSGNCINSAWVPNDLQNKDEKNGYYTPPYGSFLEIFRSKNGQVTSKDAEGPYYVVGHSSISYQNSTSVYINNRPDSTLILNLTDLENGEQIPRACKYISQWQGQLVQAGRPVNTFFANVEYPSSFYSVAAATYKEFAQYTEALLCDYQTAYWTDALTPEGFPQDAQYSMTVDTVFADEITGIAPNKEAFFIFKERSTAVMTGTAANIADQFLEVLEADAGCSSHRSIKDVRGSLIWLDGINGFYACVAGRLPENIGWPIQDYQKINALNLNYSRACAANFRKESLYICSVEGTTFVFDYADNGPGRRSCWYVWDGLDIKSIVATSNNTLLFTDSYITWKMKLTKSVYDYTDHTSAINLVLNTAWLNQGFPTIDKHYVGLWINSIQGDFTLTVKQYGNFLEDLIGTQSDVQFIAESSSKKFVKAQVKASLPKLSSISWGMENSEKNKWVRIQGYELQYSQDFGLGEPKR